MMSCSSLYFCSTPCTPRAGVVVLFTDDQRIELAAGGVERIHGGGRCPVDAMLRESTTVASR